jgi:hypothetical protein
MGGASSEYYDRDVTPTRDSTLGGRSYSRSAEKMTSRKKADSAVLPLNRTLRTLAKHVVFWDFDDTGSMNAMPKICVDKAPMIVGEVSRNNYLPRGWEIGVGVIGDINSDTDPIQFGDPCEARTLDEWIQRLHLVGGGGGGHPEESYEMAAYFLANRCDMPNAVDPMVIFTADEFFRTTLPAATLTAHFGGQHTSTTAAEVFKKLLEKFKGNVVLIRRPYPTSGYDDQILSQWEGVLGKDRIVKLETDRAVGDLVIGTIALLSGSRTLPEYMDDVRNRPTNLGGVKFEPQSPERIAEIGRALKALDDYCEKKWKGKRGQAYKKGPDSDLVSSSKKNKKTDKDKESAPTTPPADKPKKSKPGRIY